MKSLAVAAIATLLATSPSFTRALCPFMREAGTGKGDIDLASVDPSKLRQILEKLDLRDVPNNHEEEPGLNKRQFTTFNENQEIDVSGVHAWAPPGPNDLRGPCPGLNALANHGYLPRSGVVGLVQAATAVQQVYGLAYNIGLPLSLYATLVDGDPIAQTWSIGGAPPPLPGLPIIGSGNGLSGSHNKYETDASPTRGDYYLNGGDVATLRVPLFKALYDLAKNDPVPNYDLGVVAKHRKYTLENSISTNPYFFWGPFAGPVVSNAAHTFIPALMSNHSAEYPNGILDKETLKNFFAITENPDGSLSYRPGYERIPYNWYRRPLGPQNEYHSLYFAQDLVVLAQTTPGVVAVGGNTGTVNSFTGVNLADITGGVYNTQDLLNPQKFVCFFYQISLAVVPDILRSKLLGTVLATALNLLQNQLQPFIDPNCAKIANYNDDFAAQFPGAALP